MPWWIASVCRLDDDKWSYRSAEWSEVVQLPRSHTSRSQTFGVVLHTVVCKLTRFVLASSFQRYDATVDSIVENLLQTITEKTKPNIPRTEAPLTGTVLALDRGYFTRSVQKFVRQQQGLLTVGTNKRGWYEARASVMVGLKKTN